jgi:hypothetical protein
MELLKPVISVLQAFLSYGLPRDAPHRHKILHTQLMLEAQRVYVWSSALGITYSGDVLREIALSPRLQDQLMHILRGIEKVVRNLSRGTPTLLADTNVDGYHDSILAVLIRDWLHRQDLPEMVLLDINDIPEFSNLVSKVGRNIDSLWASTGDIVHTDRLDYALSWLVSELDGIEVLRHIAAASATSRPLISQVAFYACREAEHHR